MNEIGDDIKQLMAMVPQLSDEEWAARETRIAAEKERLRAADDARTERVRGPLPPEMPDWPSRLLEALPTARETAPAIAALASWRHTERCIAVLSGSVGCGKTLAAAWWAKRHGRVGFVRASTFARVSRYGEDHAGYLERSALCLDDLGAEYLDAKGSFVVDLDELIDTYHADMKPLIITTNCNWQQFEARYGCRITDRLKECGEWFNVTGGSMRGAR